MALSIEQIIAVSYPDVVAEMKKPANQWAENAALRVMEKQGAIVREDLGPTIEMPLDYRINPDGGVMAGDQDASPMLKTEVITSASYTPAQLDYTVTWTKGDDAKNPTKNQKVSLVKSLLENGINSHDDLIERSIFTSSSAGGDELQGLDVIVPTSGAGTVGGIDAGTETWWANYSGTYVDDTDIEAAATLAMLTSAKGSGSSNRPSFVLSGATPFSLFASTQQAKQRWADANEANLGFKVLKIQDADWAYSQYGGSNVYFLNPKNFKLIVSKQYFRDKGETYPVPGQNAFWFKIYSALQFVTNNKSRNAVIHL